MGITIEQVRQYLQAHPDAVPNSWVVAGDAEREAAKTAGGHISSKRAAQILGPEVARQIEFGAEPAPT